MRPNARRTATRWGVVMTAAVALLAGCDADVGGTAAAGRVGAGIAASSPSTLPGGADSSDGGTATSPSSSSDGGTRSASGPSDGTNGTSTPSTKASGTGTSGSKAPGAATGTGSALAALALLPVKGRAPMTGYARDQFGPAWKDVDRNGCDTRDDVLARDLVAVVRRDSCVISSGTLHDPYTGSTIAFVRGVGTSSKVQIDHVVALGDAWQKGAQSWDATRRTAFANDPLELLAVDGPTNGQKGDGDAATWLPPRKAYRCAYVARQVAVKYTYGLWVTQAERDAIAGILATCPQQALPAGSAVPPASAGTGSAAAGAVAGGLAAGGSNVPGAESGSGGGASSSRSSGSSANGSSSTGKPGGSSSSPSSSGGAVVYANCTAAWAAGVAPLHRGDPGYSTKLDRDGDGVACEYRP